MKIKPPTLFLAAFPIIFFLSSCGGGGGGGTANETSFDLPGITYQGSQSQATVSKSNAAILASRVISTSGLSYSFGGNILGARTTEPVHTAKLSITQSAHEIQRVTQRSLDNVGLDVSGRAARFTERTPVDQTEICESGTTVITGFVNDDLTGKIDFDYRNCRFGSITINGRLSWTFSDIIRPYLVPATSVFRLSTVEVSSPQTSASLSGTIQTNFDFSANSERMTLSNFVVRDDSSGRMSMASSLIVALQYDTISSPNFVHQTLVSGRVFDSLHGYVDIVSEQPLLFNDIYDAFPADGAFRLLGIGSVRVTALPDTLVRIEVDTDVQGDGGYDFSVVAFWNTLTDPNVSDNTDLDMDGIDDSWEIDNNLNPLDLADATTDFDHDGFTNIAEYINGTNPNDATSIPPLENLWKAPATATPTVGNYVYLESESGDSIGLGRSYLYTDFDAVITLSTGRGHIGISVNGDEDWDGDFQAMIALTQLQPGYYGEMQRYPFHDTSKGGMSWTGEGRACNSISGWFVVDDVTYNGNVLEAVDLRFGQHCGRGVTALRGQIHWVASDVATPPGPVSPPPANLWQAPQNATPLSGNYVYVESLPGDSGGVASNYLYTDVDAAIAVSTTEGRLHISINGDERWTGSFRAMNTLSLLQLGYYGELLQYPFHNPAKGGLHWSGAEGQCNTEGWFVIDRIVYDDTVIKEVDLRFSQHCMFGSDVRGQIHWSSDNIATPPGPVSPIPEGLWQAASGVTPDSGSYIYLESQPGDFIGRGSNYLYVKSDAIIRVDSSDGRLNIYVNGDESWNASFQAMNTLNQLESGYYRDLQRYPFHNPVKGGLSWSGEGRGCNTLEGWFVVDSVSYNGNILESIGVRFEQRCEGASAALRGQIHWEASEVAVPPGPVTPAPTNLWQAPGAATPVSGNYVYIESEPGDFVGQGNNYLYTSDDIALTSTGDRISISVNGSERWNGHFQAMNILSQLELGYYSDLRGYPFHNPIKGGMSWGGQNGCEITGWFVVDRINFNSATLSNVDLRFEQRCEGATAALRGQIHWSQDG